MSSLYFVIAAIAGLAVGYVLRNLLARTKIGGAEGKAEKILEHARQQEKELLLTAKDQAIKITEEAKKQETEFRQQILRTEQRLEKKESDIDERGSAEVSNETTTSTVTLPNEEMKGRIIGKEGRNIKAFEQMLGVEVIVDESPDTVIISGFNSVRRYVAKVTLEKLIKDGRIHT